MWFRAPRRENGRQDPRVQEEETAVVAWWRRRGGRGARFLEDWAVATATTVDGVRATLTAELSADVRDGSLDPARVTDAVEDALRRLVAGSAVADLPVAGSVPVLDVRLPDGVTLDHVTVTSADVEVSAELRRLVAAWTG